MKPINEPHGLCSVDPITLTGLALGAMGGLAGGLAGGAMGGGAQAPAAPQAPPTMAAASSPTQQPQTSRPAIKSNQPTFLGAAATPGGSVGGGATPPVQSGQKTLLGQ